MQSPLTAMDQNEPTDDCSGPLIICGAIKTTWCLPTTLQDAWSRRSQGLIYNHHADGLAGGGWSGGGGRCGGSKKGGKKRKSPLLSPPVQSEKALAGSFFALQLTDAGKTTGTPVVMFDYWHSCIRNPSAFPHTHTHTRVWRNTLSHLCILWSQCNFESLKSFKFRRACECVLRSSTGPVITKYIIFCLCLFQILSVDSL